MSRHRTTVTNYASLDRHAQSILGGRRFMPISVCLRPTTPVCRRHVYVSPPARPPALSQKVGPPPVNPYGPSAPALSARSACLLPHHTTNYSCQPPPLHKRVCSLQSFHGRRQPSSSHSTVDSMQPAPTGRSTVCVSPSRPDQTSSKTECVPRGRPSVRRQKYAGDDSRRRERPALFTSARI